MSQSFRNDKAIAEARNAQKRASVLPSQQIIDINTQPVKTETINLRYTIEFDYSFDVTRKISQDELVAIIKDAVLKMQEQMVPHLQEYPNLIVKELTKRNLLDISSFRTTQ